jgi:hypothetical protein
MPFFSPPHPDASLRADCEVLICQFIQKSNPAGAFPMPNDIYRDGMIRVPILSVVCKDICKAFSHCHKFVIQLNLMQTLFCL